MTWPGHPIEQSSNLQGDFNSLSTRAISYLITVALLGQWVREDLTTYDLGDVAHSNLLYVWDSTDGLGKRLPFSSGIGGSTGATDNAALRADGAGGATLQTSPVVIDDTGNVRIPSNTGLAVGVNPIIEDNSASGYIGINRTGLEGSTRLYGGVVFFGDGLLTTITAGGKESFDATLTAAGTTGARTINKPAGSVNFAGAAASLVVTNSLVSTSSIVLAIVMTNDATMKACAAVVAAGSFELFADAVPTAETKVAFLVIN